MRTIGLIGGMSWESTVTYYQIINETVRARLGGLHSAKILLYSVDFAPMERLQEAGRWAESGLILSEIAKRLERAGADAIVLCTNTMHRVSDIIQKSLTVPFHHIADTTADALLEQGIRRVALLGTHYTMKLDFFRTRLHERGIDVAIPTPRQMTLIHDVIYRELCLGILSPQSKAAYLDIIGQMHRHGAEGVILGCTEIGLLVSQKDTPVPLFDTTRIHATRVAEWMVERDGRPGPREREAGHAVPEES